MKRNTLTFLLAILCILAKAQTIVPATTDVYCPGETIIFQVTVPGLNNTNPTVSGTSSTGIPGSQAIQVNNDITSVHTIDGNTVYRFTGKFQDYAAPQGMLFSYGNSVGTVISTTFTYKNIASFTQGSTVTSSPQPNLTSIQATFCTSQSFNLTFQNVKYIDLFVPSSSSYGSVASYQYLLPAGWQLGTAVSDGVNWLSATSPGTAPGTTAVTITSDLNHGNRVSIQVRGAPCSGTAAPGPAVSIPITRPTISHFINGPLSLCPGGSGNFAVTALQAGSTVSWSASPANIVSLSATSGSQINATGQAHGNTTVTAVITDPCGGTSSASIPVTVSQLPAPTLMNVGFATSDGTTTVDVQRLTQYALSIAPISGATSYFWSIGNNATLDGGQGNTEVNVTITGTPGTTTSFSVQPVNECGRGGGLVVQANIVGTGNCDFCALQVSPNPVRSDLYVTMDRVSDAVEKKQTLQTAQVTLYDFYTNQPVKTWELRTGQKQYHLDVTGVRKGQYVLQVVLGKEKRTKQLLIGQ